MEIVIKIDDKRYKDILRISTVQLKGRTPTLEQIIANGTPLPEHHGNLIDRDFMIDDLNTEITNLKMDGLKGTATRYDDLVSMIERLEEFPVEVEADY